MATLTPFRFPGAKNKLLTPIMNYLKPLITNEGFIDAFVGGGSVALEVAQQYPNIPIFINDKDYWIYCFWSVVAHNDDLKLQELFRLLDQPVTIERFLDASQTPLNASSAMVEYAYRAIFFNRTCFSGIVKREGDKVVSSPIGGKEQKSKYKVNCRYNSKKLKEKIEICHKLLVDRTVVSNCNVLEYDILWNSNISAYLDPPYYVKGGMLYNENMSKEDHIRLANKLQSRDNWILSYDDCDEIRSLYKSNNVNNLSALYSINGKKDSWNKKNELLILR